MQDSRGSSRSIDSGCKPPNSPCPSPGSPDSRRPCRAAPLPARREQSSHSPHPGLALLGPRPPTPGPLSPAGPSLPPAARAIGDRMGEAKASGNLGNTLKVLQRFDEAVVCCQRHLDIAQEQGDKVRPPPRPAAPAQVWDRGPPPALAPWEGAFRTRRTAGLRPGSPRRSPQPPISHGSPPLAGLPLSLPAPRRAFRGPERGEGRGPGRKRGSRGRRQKSSCLASSLGPALCWTPGRRALRPLLYPCGTGVLASLHRRGN